MPMRRPTEANAREKKTKHLPMAPKGLKTVFEQLKPTFKELYKKEWSEDLSLYTQFVALQYQNDHLVYFTALADEFKTLSDNVAAIQRQLVQKQI